MHANINARTRLAMAALCAALIAGCGGDNPEKLLASAKAFVEKRDFNAAVIQLKTILQKQPDNAEARYLLGTTLLAIGDAPSAEKELRKAIEYHYKGPDASVRLAHAMRLQGEPKKVIKEFGSVTLPDGEAQAALLSEVGLSQIEAGSLPEGKAALEKAITLSPNSPGAKVGLAIVALRDGGDTAKAEGLIQDALTQDPKFVDALMVKADLQNAKKDEAGALATYQEVFKLAPFNFLGANNLIIIQNSKKDFDGARATLAAFRKAAPGDPRGSYLQAMIAYREGKLDAAREAVLQVLKVAPQYPQALLVAGSIEFDAHKYTQAAEYFRKLTEAMPEDPRTRGMLANAYLRAGQLDRAAAAIEPLMKAAPNSAAVLALAGELALAKGEASKATAFFEKAVANGAKDDSSVKTKLAQARMVTGEFDRAMRDLEALSAADSSNAQADLALISGYSAKRQFAKVLDATQALRKKLPDSPVPDYLDGNAHVGLGDLAKARESYEKALKKQADHMPSATSLAQLDLAAHKPDDAMGRFKAVLEKSPTSVPALLALAGIQNGIRQPRAETEATLSRAVKADPTSVDARVAMIDFLLAGGERDRALQTARDASAAIPDNADIVDRLGLALRASGDANQALASFGKAAALAPRSPLPHVHAAAVYIDAKNYTAAVTAMKKAVALEPANLANNEILARAQAASGNAAEALQTVRALQKTAPRNPGAYALEGNLQAASGHWADAETAYRKALGIAPTPQAAVSVYETMTKQGKQGPARAFALDWIEKQPKDTRMLRALGDTAMAAGDFKTAGEHYRTGLSRNPKDVILLNNLAWVSGQLKDPKAVDYARQALELAPDNPAVMDTLGVLLSDEGQVSEGLEMLRKARERSPATVPIRLNYARVLAKSGDKAGARKDLEELAATLPADSPARAEVQKVIASL